jgi:hypothetical protein
MKHSLSLRKSPYGSQPALVHLERALARLVLWAFLAPILAIHLSAQDVTTWHNDPARTGVQPSETLLTAANVNSQQFGKVFSLPVLGDVYAQPLYLAHCAMSGGAMHNVLIVATAEDYVYAFDADGNNPPEGYLWRQSLLGPGETWISDTDVNTVDINPNIGIIGTPVVDRAGGTLYVVAASKNTSGASSVFYQRLHALNIADGAEKLNGPTLIAATVPGTGNGGTSVSFDPLLENQRAALLLAPSPGVGSGNSVFIAWGSHGDKGGYHGWVMAYDAANIAEQNGVWTSTPNGIGGGIWMSGGGLSTDGKGNIFAASGNGLFDANTAGGDYGDSAFRLTLSPLKMQEADFFTPADELSLDTGDHDMGMSALILIPSQPGPLPDLTVTTDKTGAIYLLNRDNLGGFGTPQNGSIQSFSAGYGIHSSAAFFNNEVYIGLDNGPLQAWSLNPQTDQLTPQSATSTVFATPAFSGGGGTPSISANGTSNGVAWIIQDTEYNYGPAILHAYNAADLTQELYNSQQAADGRDNPAIAVKFTTPTIANGRVYVGGRNAVTVYGLLSTYSPLTATPVIQLPSGTYAGPQTTTVSDLTPNASIYYTTDGDAPAASSTLYTGPIQITRSDSIEAIAIAPGYAQSDDAVATYTIEPPGQVQVPLGAEVNAIGLFADGSKPESDGLDGAGHAYSSNQIGKSITLWGVKFVLGPAGQKDVVTGTGAPSIPLPAGVYNNLEFLGTAIGSNQNGVVFTVTYSDGTVSHFTQNMSAWTSSKDHSGESIAYQGTYCDTSSGGRDTEEVYLYRYSFPLNSGKSVKSVTLPANANVAVAAISLLVN